MMTPSEFARWARNKKLDTDGCPKEQPYQCADLAKVALEKIWNVKNFSFTLPYKNPHGYVKSLWYNFDSYPQLKDIAYKVPNTRDYTPKLGDLIIWDGNVEGITGVAGHIAYGLGVNYGILQFESLDQNWGKKYYVAEITHRYTGVLGAIRMKLKVSTANLNIRSGAGTNYSIIGTIDKGTVVMPLEQKNNYTRISKDGWVSSKYLE